MTRVRHAHDELQKLIATAEPGQRLGSKAEIADQLGVAAGTLNQAVRLLQNRGFLDVRPGPGGGLFVAEPDPIEQMAVEALRIYRGPGLLRDAFRVRKALDPLVIEDVMQHLTHAGDVRVRAVLKDLHQAALADDHELFSDLSLSFQLAIADISEHEFARLIFRTGVEVIRHSTAMLFPEEVDLMSAYNGHVRLWQAIVDKDLDAAHDAIQGAIARMDIATVAAAAI
ncbi:MAG: FadR family transcriptional regulator [Leucobacter sp.]|nr:FadR family transcriptional regulator [Leucobacter sp.]